MWLVHFQSTVRAFKRWFAGFTFYSSSHRNPKLWKGNAPKKWFHSHASSCANGNHEDWHDVPRLLVFLTAAERTSQPGRSRSGLSHALNHARIHHHGDEIEETNPQRQCFVVAPQSKTQLRYSCNGTVIKGKFGSFADQNDMIQEDGDHRQRSRRKVIDNAHKPWGLITVSHYES